MQINYTVTSCSEETIDVLATVPGLGEVTAKVMGLVVEVTSEDGQMGHTFRFTPADMADAKAKFAVGSPVVATFTFPEAE